ncbi:hypothetical protein L1049_004563 [Liquidambar formosana]|uniref:Uncharacterized protein n=1 Tax=Liquidambar formosana TaxID=63359 RepID=A0AAP0RTL2_LIQFO
MVRAPCCEKMGLKKGPWTPEEDHILINYIQLYGHGNWRALPKQAGLLRCGKSCRLRWTNYLRPDIKRGNFSREEEETIIQLHEMLGNRWSAIAARLPGRTDNEIKNVWHTHLKKRLKQNETTPQESRHRIIDTSKYDQNSAKEPEKPVNHFSSHARVPPYVPVSPQQSCSDTSSSVTTFVCDDNVNTCNRVESPENLPEMDDNFWSEVLSAADNSVMAGSDFDCNFVQFPFLPLPSIEPVHAYGSNMFDGMDFWSNNCNLFTRGGD